MEVVKEAKQACLVCAYTHQSGIAELNTLTNGACHSDDSTTQASLCLRTQRCSAESPQFGMCKLQGKAAAV